MENVTLTNLLDPKKDLGNKLNNLFTWPYMYYCDSIKDFKDNETQIRQNLLNLKKKEQVFRMSSKKTPYNGALICLTNLWGDLEPLNPYFSKINVRDNTGELGITSFHCQDYGNLATELLEKSCKKGELDSLAGAIVTLSLFSALEETIIGEKTPVLTRYTKADLQEMFSEVNTLIGSLVGFYSFNDRNVYLKRIYSQRIHRTKREKAKLEIPLLNPLPART